MLLILRNFRNMATIKFNIDKFSRKDYQTMCMLLKQKYPIYNQAIQVYSDVKMLDENGKLLGRYEASQARKKALNLKKDLILISKDSVPAICKIIPFRENILNLFYEQIVTKRNEQLIKKASSTKHLKISLTLTQGDMSIKSRQIVQLAKKNLNVRIFINCKQSQVNQAAAKIDNLKAMLQNKCVIETDLNIVREQQDEQEEESSGNKNSYKKKDSSDEPRRTVSIVVKSKSNEFMALLEQSSHKQSDGAIVTFLKRFYKQQDVQMMDLKQQSIMNENKMLDQNFQTVKKLQQKNTGEIGSSEQQKQNKQFEQRLVRLKLDNPDGIKREYIAKSEGKNRILSERLKKILQIEL